MGEDVRDDSVAVAYGGGPMPDEGMSGPVFAYTSIRSWIVEGRLRPGERLIEQRIAAELNLSRTPVREAVRMLAADGLVVTARNRGAVVRTLGRQDILDTYELRARLESYACELAAGRATADDLAAVDAGIRDFAKAMRRRELGHLERTRLIGEANRRVHAAIIAASRHGRLAHLLSSTVDAPLVFEALREFTNRQLERSNLFHQLIRDMIAKGEGQRAAQLMHEHILQGRDQLLADLDR
ncbi:DNA-binding GntR family transcriptional regulator [Amycolatopsis bartoniae]|uniref:GntR family transcriptional regulator n=1 Tax=Amycolatopsis bartoniae TaxID=941986 RepID=A0A8H9MC86_9PSEU|nr:GntR family transcriptional regulator [Amycolatopsis bartoniae]MBB2937895.1 DNA-binding GntR family transcriptional regulator [Amycolatopsis bartoniae]TVT08608.1 GntR family transcriptional regulator [Amycolatopsis bartoniae]GHF41525.1 GntR family transcriptional regulator [Amycolatopsis bartoniae]